MTLLCLDIGSRHTGVAVLADAPPVSVLHAATVRIDAADLAPAVAAILAISASHPGCRVIAEHAAWYPMAGADPAKLMATHTAWMVTHDLLEALRRAGLVVETMARQTWAHRVCPHTRGGVTDAMVTEALRTLLGSECGKLADVHQRDAAGVGLGAILGKPAKRPRKRARRKADPTPEELAKRQARREARMAAIARHAARKALGPQPTVAERIVSAIRERGPLSVAGIAEAINYRYPAACMAARDLVRAGTLVQAGYGQPYALAAPDVTVVKPPRAKARRPSSRGRNAADDAFDALLRAKGRGDEIDTADEEKTCEATR